ncbi:hypothetical protein ERO13_D11G197450v2 [Gossypium hirsutum]|uniref:Uncharacterized protein n=3 Tax=Gossypium TaxID=3633 RepID=A0A5J5PHD9_GOSBA|nr:hypothetical protein ES319_D11G209000v1 [Gossypium barbadense]KAG4121291.1 hypothetical protein ERO13_D11G197450v2 [Gossypium hirsutum]TYG45996.1 hypothetical protein ES288_D11G220800v1 [Gossypium darwinii]TYH44788.1 hypothetical protein ES332_D11G219100v1 [Gossypium tomentosum]
MASVRSNCLFFLLIVLIFSHEILPFSHGRSLEFKKNKEKVNLLNPDGKSVDARPIRNNVAVPRNISAFRPTTPGHSPGVGHSILH